MGLPVLLSWRPKARRTNPFQFSIQCWTDRAKTLPLDLTQFGNSWYAQAKVSPGSTLAAQFTIDASLAAQGRLTLSLDAATVMALTEPFYRFDVVVTGGGLSPLTIFEGIFLVEGEVTVVA